MSNLATSLPALDVDGVVAEPLAVSLGNMSGAAGGVCAVVAGVGCGHAHKTTTAAMKCGVKMVKAEEKRRAERAIHEARVEAAFEAEPAATFVEQLRDAPAGSLVVVDTAAAGTRVKSVKIGFGAWVDLDNVHRMTRTAIDLAERLAPFADAARIIIVDVAPAEAEPAAPVEQPATDAVSMATVAQTVYDLFPADYDDVVDSDPEEDVRVTLQLMGLDAEAAALDLSRATAEAVLGRIVFDRAGLSL